MDTTPTPRSEMAGYNDTHAEADLLGRIVLVTVNTPDSPIPLSHVKDVLDSVALGDFCPPSRAAADVFRTTSKALLTSSREPDTDGSTVVVSLKDVTTNPDEIVRRVVVEHRNASQQRLYFGQTWDIRFRKDSGTIDLYPINADADGRITPRDRLVDPRPGDDLVTLLRAEYNAALSAVHPEGLRSLTTNILRKAQGVDVRNGNGGAYFVPEAKATYAIALEAAASQIPGVYVHSFVLPKGLEKDADMLAGAISAATATDADALIRSMQEAKKDANGAVRRSTMANLMSRQREIKERLSTFTELLGDQLEDCQTRADVIDGLLAELVAKA